MIVLICFVCANLSQVAPSGYEDYIKAANVVASAKDIVAPENANIAEWADGLLKKYGAACDLVRKGNSKGVEPLFRTEVEAAFPELHGFKKIRFLFEAEIFKRISEGKPNQAADSLADVMTFARNVQTTSSKGYEVGEIILENVLIMFDKNRRAFAEKGLEAIAKRSRQLLDVPALELAMKAEIDVRRNSNELKAMSASERAATLKRISEIEMEWKNKFATEERIWKQVPVPVGINELMLNLEIGQQYLWKRAILVRTKLRLAQATALILLYELRTFKLPDSLVDAIGEQAAYDPATGSAFFYGKRDDAFVLYRARNKVMDKIELGVLYQEEQMVP